MKKFKWILLCIVLAAAAWWWTHRATYTPGETFLAIPANVDIISSHERPAERVAELIENPVIRLALQSAEADLEELDAFCSDANQVLALSAILPKRLVVARLPDTRTPEGTWLCASWVGNQSTQFNLLAGLLAGDALEQVKHPSGYTLWRITEAHEHIQTYFAVHRELLLMSMGVDESGLLSMLETLALEKPSFDPAKLFGEDRVTGPHPDRTLVQGSKDGEEFLLHMDIQQADATALNLLFECPDLAPDSSVTAPDPKLLNGFEALVGDRSRLGLMMPASWAAALGESYLDQLWGPLTGDLFGFLGTRPVFLSAFDGDMGGQLKILRIPSMALAIPVTNPQEAETLMNQVLLKINKRIPLRLYSEKVVGRDNTWAFVSSAPGGYRALKGNERAGYRILDDWLILSSSLLTLKQLPVGTGAGAPHAIEPGWGLTYGWIDLNAAMKSVRNGLSAYMLGLAFDSSAGAAELREKLLMYRRWAEMAGQCGDVQFSTQKVDKNLRVRVKQSTRRPQKDPIHGKRNS